MKTTPFISLGALLLVACSQPKIKEFESLRERISLAGTWQCDSGQINLPGSIDQSRLVALNGNKTETTRLTRLHPFQGKMNYLKDVDIPESFQGKRVRLILERTKPSVIWVDGDSISSNQNLLTPQLYDLSSVLSKPGKHTLRIQVDNSSDAVADGVHGSHAWTDHTQTNWNGIIGDIALEAYSQTYLDSVKVYPDVNNRVLKVQGVVVASAAQQGVLSVEAFGAEADNYDAIAPNQQALDIKRGINRFSLDIPFSDRMLLWDEFDPATYRMNVTFSAGDVKDNSIVNFGVRDFSTRGTQFVINDKIIFLRGKHDGCVFPLTGYPSMDKAEWRRQMLIAKSFGINHYRFHSWTPPLAAFEAADEVGIYLQVELPFWGTMDRNKTRLNETLMREALNILEAYGNHPSFTMLALGNELNGDLSLMQDMLKRFEQVDRRHLYSFGANNNLGTAGQVDGEDFFVTCRVGKDMDSTYSTHVRSSFSFADAYKGGILNATQPATDCSYQQAITRCSVPVVSHENCQFQVYPDYDEIKKYTGVLYPYNYEVFRQRLEQKGMADQAKDFHRVTGHWAAQCYKADIEMCLRTPGFGGFQMLDLQDYPGQGSALVGILDAFMEDKGCISAEEFHQFCAPLVVLAEFPSYCLNKDSMFRARIAVANYSAAAVNNKKVIWRLTASDGRTVASDSYKASAGQGSLSFLGDISADLSKLTCSEKLHLEISFADVCNGYDLWAYCDAPAVEKPAGDVKIVNQLTAEVLSSVSAGQKIVYLPELENVQQQSVGGLFTPDYWNYAMFKGISEWLKREVSPGTLSILTNPAHPLFKNFPTDESTSWQWWSLLKNSRPLILDAAPAGYKPIVQVVDNVERNHKLGLVFEFRIGKGGVLVCMSDFSDTGNLRIEQRAFYNSLVEYAGSQQFNPATEISPLAFLQLFDSQIEEKKIIEVKNITSYE